MTLTEIYKPIRQELKAVETQIEDSLLKTSNKKILEINRYLLTSPGKRIRPALVILSTKASKKNLSQELSTNITKIAAAIELIHMASLLHDDVIDHSHLRHKKSTINSKWGMASAIALGDYIYSEAFNLISQYGNTDIMQCISQATKSMCEGEFSQVTQRDNVDLMRKNYLLIIKKKTASLFMSSCQVGNYLFESEEAIRTSLKEYGLNFGIAFQMHDDYCDLISDKSRLGKKPGQDLKMGEITIPILNLLEVLSSDKRKELKSLLKQADSIESIGKIKNLFLQSSALKKSQNDILHYLTLANNKINSLGQSDYKNSLLSLTMYLHHQ